MEWTMPDGSTFYTQAVLQDTGDFWYTSVTAIVDGKAFASRVDVLPEELEMSDLLTTMVEVPEENIYPTLPAGFLMAPAYDPTLHYLKSPSFEWDDTRPGQTFVADRLLSEVTFYEKLRSNPHPGIAEYLGCRVENERIKQLCLRRYECNLIDSLERQSLDEKDIDRLVVQVVSAARHLHKLGYAHNDINAYNICLDNRGDAVLIDFDSCTPLDEVVVKGVASEPQHGQLISDEQNDWIAIGLLDRMLRA